MTEAQAGGTGRRAVTVLLLLTLPVLVDPGVMSRIDAWRSTPQPAGPGAFALLHVWAPLVAVSAAILLLLPGLVLASAWRPTAPWQLRILLGLAAGLGLLAVVVPALEALGLSMRGRAFAMMVLLLAVAAWGVTRGRLKQAGPIDAPDIPLVTALLALVAFPVAALAPKFFWESFNGDGAHAFEASRLLLRSPVPFWPEGSGQVATFPGMTSFLFAYPTSWYLRLFGEVDVAARLPFTMYLPLLVVALDAAASTRDGASRRPPWIALTALVPYALAMSFSATYNPYAADIALPATQDTLFMVFVMGTVAAWLQRDRGLLVVMAALSFASLPSGLILLGFLGTGALVLERPRPWRRVGWLFGLALGLLLASALAPRLLASVGLPLPGREYGVAGILRYFAFLQLTDWHRVLWVAVMCGFAPFLTMVRWRQLDTGARLMVLMAWAYFLFFFVQAYVSLHHFVPPALLLLGAYWREMGANPGRQARVATLAFTAAAVAFAFPRRFSPHRTGEVIGQRVAVLVPGYSTSSPEVFRASTLLNTLFPYDWDPSVPGAYGGSPLVWNRYARGPGMAMDSAQYVLQPLSLESPPGMREVAHDERAALFVRSDSAWAADRSTQPATSPGSRWLGVPRGVLFRSVPRGASSGVLDVVAWIEARGIDLTPLLNKLEVRR